MKLLNDTSIIWHWWNRGCFSRQEKYYFRRAKLLINKVDICFNVSDSWSQAIFIQSPVYIERRIENPCQKNNLTYHGISNTDFFHLLPEVWKHITTSQHVISFTNVGKKAEILHILIWLEVHLEPISCTVYEENYHPHPSSWQVGKVCLKRQGHVAVSLASHMLLSWIWSEASCWALLQMPTQQSLLSRIRLTS